MAIKKTTKAGNKARGKTIGKASKATAAKRTGKSMKTAGKAAKAPAGKKAGAPKLSSFTFPKEMSAMIKAEAKSAGKTPREWVHNIIAGVLPKNPV